MKRYIIIFCFFVFFLPTTLSAQFSLSAGGGGLLGYTFTRYTMEGNGLTSTQTMDRFDYGGFLFFDAAYAEFAVMFQGGSNSWSEAVESSSGKKFIDGRGTGSSASLGFSLLGRYPFTINEKWSWFPLFGVEYHVVLAEKRKPTAPFKYDKEYSRAEGIGAEDRDKNNNSYPLSAWNSFWIDIGAGLDYDLSGPLYLRAELLFGFRLPTVYEMGALEVVKEQLNVSDPKIGGLTGSPTFKIAAGYKFN